MADRRDAPLAVVAVVGRPSVGKSTLFNRLVGRREALVHDRPGVTRDRHYGEVEWGGRHFTVVDTGGLWDEAGGPLGRAVREQAERALDEAAAALLVVDGRSAPTSDDVDLVDWLRRSNKPVFIALNKLDTQKAEDRAGMADFLRLGLGTLYPVSAEHGRGIGALLDDLTSALPLPDEGEGEAEVAPAAGVPRVAVLGRPNVGKSTFINRLLGERRFVESEEAGTTRDALDAEVTAGGRTYVLTDTAGIRRKSRQGDALELASIERAEEARERADVAAVMLDAEEPAVEGDARILGICADAAKALVIVVNKADRLTGAKGRRGVEDLLAEHLPFLPPKTPVLFVSALSGSGMNAFLPLAGRLYDQAGSKLPTPELNRFLREAEDAHPAPHSEGRPVRLYYLAQVGVHPPTFRIHANRPKGITDDYRRLTPGSAEIDGAARLQLNSALFKGPGRSIDCLEPLKRWRTRIRVRRTPSSGSCRRWPRAWSATGSY
jgi:GTP-binding protein